MTLPHDGIPRISSEGLAMVERGLAGDFTGWERRPQNHPMEIPLEMLSNLRIMADPETMDFIACPWYGMAYPRLDGTYIAPYIRFNGIDRQEACTPATATVRLTWRDGTPWDWYGDLPIGLDDRGCGAKGTTVYSEVSQDPLSEDDGEDCCTEEPCGCATAHRVTLEDWA